MKYYHKHYPISNVDEFYAYRSKLINRPIYAVAYDINDDTEHHVLRCEPVLGEIHNQDCSDSVYETLFFTPYRKGTNQKRKSGTVAFYSRTYADTYEEAVEIYNELVQERIDNLKRMISLAELDKITEK